MESLAKPKECLTSNFPSEILFGAVNASMFIPQAGKKEIYLRTEERNKIKSLPLPFSFLMKEITSEKEKVLYNDKKFTE